MRKRVRPSGAAFDLFYGSGKGEATTIAAKRERVKPKPWQTTIPLERAYELMEHSVQVAFRKYANLTEHFDSNDDLKSEILLYWGETRYLEMYDPKITSEKYFISIGVRNWVSSYMNKNRLKAYSGDSTFDEESGSTFDSVPDKRTDDPLKRLMAQELLESLLEEPRKKGLFRSHFGMIPFTEKTVFFLFMEGYLVDEIALTFEVTKACIYGIMQEARERLQGK